MSSNVRENFHSLQHQQQSLSKVSIWVRSEPFIFGVLSVQPHPRLLYVSNIKKLVNYARSKGKSGFPRISYNIWKYISYNKIQISSDLAWNLFQSCMILSWWAGSRSGKKQQHNQAQNPASLSELDLWLSQCASDAEREEVRSSLSIDLLTFILFLYIQQINKISLRASASSLTAEWPGMSMQSAGRSSDSDSSHPTNKYSSSHHHRQYKHMDENNHYTFVLENIAEILKILADPELSSGAGNEAWLTQEALEALNFLLEGSVEKSGADRCRSIRPFSEIVSLPQLQSRVGHSKVTQAYSSSHLLTFVRSNMAKNPYSVEACLNTGQRLQWPLPASVESEQECARSSDEKDLQHAQQHQQSSQTRKHAASSATAALHRKQRIVTNAHILSKDSGKGNKLVMMSAVSHQTIARSSGTLEQSCVKVHRCHSSYLYLLSPLRSVSVEKCRRLLLVLGPTESTVQLFHCEDCVVVCATRRLSVTQCQRCTFYVYTPTRPVLTSGGSSGIANGSANGSAANHNQSGPPGSASPNQIVYVDQAGVAAMAANQSSALQHSEVILAPYATGYALLEEHLALAELDTRAANMWDSPLVIGDPKIECGRVGSEAAVAAANAASSNFWRVMPPEQFHPIVIPFLINNNTSRSQNRRETNKLANQNTPAASDGGSHMCIPWPAQYEKAHLDRISKYKDWQKKILQLESNENLDVEKRQVLKVFVEEHFKAWLAESGDERQLNLLDPAFLE